MDGANRDGHCRYGDTGEAPEVASVERQDAGDGIDIHHGHQMGIMGLFAGDPESEHDPLPGVQDIRSRGKQPEESPELFDFGCGAGMGHA